MSSFQSLVQGERTTGADVRTQNVTAVQAVANIVKSSLGPVGLDKVWVGGEGAGATDRWGRERRGFFFVASPPPPPRSSSRSAPHAPALSPPRQMLVDDIGDVTITNDGATILKLLEVEHPAAKVRGREKGRERWMDGGARGRATGARPRRARAAADLACSPSRTRTHTHSSVLSSLLASSPPPPPLPPSHQILVDLAELQDEEVGDGTTSVVIVAAELLRRAAVLVRHKVHPTSVIAGYRLAMREVRMRRRERERA